MKLKTIDYINCPNCGSKKFLKESYQFKGKNISDGRLICQACTIWYRIENGILDLLPLNLRRIELYKSFAAKYGLNIQNFGKTYKSNEKQKQRDFYKANFSEYEEKVVKSSFYQALDQVLFNEWLGKI